MNANIPDASAVWTTLASIPDPEFGVNIVDLGLIYSVECVDRDVNVTMTLTTPTCPSGAWIHEGVKTAVQGLTGVRQANVSVVFEPPWSPAMLSATARELLGWRDAP